MGVKKALKIIIIIIVIYMVFSLIAGWYLNLEKQNEDSINHIKNNTTTHTTVNDNSRSYSPSTNSYYSGGDLDDDWWYEEYGDYYNSAEAEKMGYNDMEDYLD